MLQEPFRLDVHHHIVPPEYVAALTAFGVKGGGGIDFPHWDPQRSLNMMDRQGIATAITSLSASPYIFRALQELVKPAQILFGSDYPWADEMIAAFTIRGIEHYGGFDDQMRRTIERENALALFPRLKEQR